MTGSSRGQSAAARVVRMAARIEDGLVILVLAVMIAVAGSAILARNLWGGGITWSEPLLRISVLWVGLLGAMIATRENQHIRIDIFSRLLAPRQKAAVEGAAALFTAAVCALLSYHGGRLVVMDWQAETTAFAMVPAWVCELVIPIGFASMAFRYVTRAVRQFRMAIP